MSRKSPVRWTDRESCLVAIEAEKIKTNPDARENRMGNGAIAKSLPSCIIIAQRVLPPDRRKTQGGVHSMADLNSWFAHHLAQRETFVPQAKAPAEPEQKTPPPPPPPDPARVLVDHLLGLISDAVEGGMMRALHKFHQQTEQAAINAGQVVRRHGGEHHAQASTDVLHPRRRIDVVGLKGGQKDVVIRSPIATAFNIRFIASDHHMSQRDLRGEVIVCTKFVNHSVQNRYKAMQGASIHFANGGPQSVIHQLELIHGNGASAPPQVMT